MRYEVMWGGSATAVTHSLCLYAASVCGLELPVGCGLKLLVYKAFSY